MLGKLVALFAIIRPIGLGVSIAHPRLRIRRVSTPVFTIVVESDSTKANLFR
jgi:hypothetical protein